MVCETSGCNMDKIIYNIPKHRKHWLVKNKNQFLRNNLIPQF